MASGLYDASYEHDACGVGMVADLHGRPDHDIVDKGLTVLERLAHRGASGAEVSTGDGAGILVQVPHRFLVGAAEAAGFSLPAPGTYAVGLAFLPSEGDDAAKRDDRRLCRATPDVADHVPQRLMDGQAGTNSRRGRLLDQADTVRSRGAGRLLDGASFDSGDCRRDAYEYPGATEPGDPGALEQELDHPLGDVEVDDGAFA